jgi:membrane protein
MLAGARDRARALLDRVPVLGRLLEEFVRIEFIDRCMLIAAQGLLALIPVFVVLAAFLPHLTGSALDEFSDATGLGSGQAAVETELATQQVRAQTGVVGIVITVFSATSFGRAVQRMYERIWQRPHVGGLTGTRRCFLWLLGWLMTLQLLAGVVHLMGAVPDRPAVGTLRLTLQVLFVSAIWWATSRFLLFGRVRWRDLALGALLTGWIEVAYSRASGVVMPRYVESSANQFGTLGVILAITTWLIGFGAVLVGSTLVGRVVSEDPTVLRVVRTVRRRLPRGGRAAPPPAAPPR